MAGEVLTRRDGAVLEIALNRPATRNALTRELHAELHAALVEAGDPAVRCVVLTGEGAGFCSGQDLREFGEVAGSIADGLERTYHPNVRLIRSLAKPVLAAVNGVAAGAGLSLALACDVRIASSTATFVPGFIGIGLVPDAGGTYFIERLLGAARAFEWMCSNRRVSAEEALEWGLVHEVVPDEEFRARVAEAAAWWAERPTAAIAGTKALLDAARGSTLDDQLAREAATQQGIVATADFAEGVAAFLERRPPRFTGS